MPPGVATTFVVPHRTGQEAQSHYRVPQHDVERDPTLIHPTYPRASPHGAWN
jgi:hypothetical protein